MLVVSKPEREREGDEGGYQKTVEKAKKKRDRMRQKGRKRVLSMCCGGWRSLALPGLEEPNAAHIDLYHPHFLCI